MLIKMGNEELNKMFNKIFVVIIIDIIIALILASFNIDLNPNYVTAGIIILTIILLFGKDVKRKLIKYKFYIAYDAFDKDRDVIISGSSIYITPNKILTKENIDEIKAEVSKIENGAKSIITFFERIK